MNGGRMDIKQALDKILNEWPSERNNPFRDNPLAQFVRTDFPSVIQQVVSRSGTRYKVIGSAGAGNWASIPWLALLDPEITSTTQKGFYPVYLFREGHVRCLSIVQSRYDRSRESPWTNRSDKAGTIPREVVPLFCTGIIFLG